MSTNTEDLSYTPIEDVTYESEAFMNIYKNSPKNVLKYLNSSLTTFVSDATE